MMDRGGGDTPTEITMYQAWKKTFKDFNTEACPVKPVKVSINGPENYLGWTENTDDVYFEYLDSAPAQIASYVYDYVEEVQIYDITDIPDDIYERGYRCVLLYSLDELNSKASEIKALINQDNFHPYSDIISECPGVENFYNASYASSNNVCLIDGKYYVWFADGD